MTNIVRSFLEELLPLWLEQFEKRRKDIGMPVEVSMPHSEQSESPPVGDSRHYLVRMYAGEDLGADLVGDESWSREHPVTVKRARMFGRREIQQ
jgi:hypothetical protein